MSKIIYIIYIHYKGVTMAGNYTGDSIQRITGLDWILIRPENHIQITDHHGQFHVIKEILNNSMDETEEQDSPGTTVLVYMFLDPNAHTYQTAIIDNGRGVPHDAIVDVFTRPYTSGKYNSEVYQNAGGLNGIGGKVVMVLSDKFRALVTRDNKIGSFYTKKVEDQDIPIVDHFVTEEFNTNITGTMVVMEPRKGYFSNVDLFIQQEYMQIVNLCRLLSMFAQKTQVVVYLVHEQLSPVFWDLPAKEAFYFIQDTYTEKATIAIDGFNPDSAMEYLKEQWGVDSTFTWELQNIKHQFNPDNGRVGYSISLYLPKILRNTCSTSIINNVPIKDQTSSHITGLVTALKEKLLPYITNPDYKDYFVSIYKLPICAALSIQCKNVKFTSLSKDCFKDTSFEIEYAKLLIDQFHTYQDSIWELLYSLIASDIETKYAVYYNKPLATRKDNKKLAAKMPTIYMDCNTPNRKDAELYIVEGTSASHIIEGRNAYFQALYMIYGKPLNVLKELTDKVTSIDRFNSYGAYVSLKEILGINPKQTDLSTANFGKIILINDADVDGGHIRSLHIGGLQTLNPYILESGMVYLANPPLYEVTLDKQRKKKLYVQDKNKLIEFLVTCLYKKSFDIKIMDGKVFKEPTKLDDESYMDLCYIVTALGEIFDELSKKLGGVPPFIIEKLTYLTAYLSPGKIDSMKLIDAFGYGTQYDPRVNILTISQEQEDVSFPLDDVRDLLYEEVLPYLHNLQWKNLKLFITTKFTDTFKNTQVSITQLYAIFKTLHKPLHITRQKGLGGVNAVNLTPLCLNPETRILHQITSLGDLHKIEALLGDEVEARKTILYNHGL